MEKGPQSGYEPNLALEQQLASASFEELSARYDLMPAADKKWNDKTQTTHNPEAATIKSEMIALTRKMKAIDEYRNLAKSPFEGGYQVGDVSDAKDIQEEIVKLRKVIDAISRDLYVEKNDLNKLRERLGMSETDDIPSLSAKKEKLSELMSIKSDLESNLALKLTEHSEEAREHTEIKNIELDSLRSSVELLSSDIRSLGVAFDERQSRGLRDLFSDQNGIRRIVSGMEDLSDNSELAERVSKLGNLITDVSRPGLNDDPESMRQIASKVAQIGANLRELPGRIQDEKQRKEFAVRVYSVADEFEKAVAYIRGKADALEGYRGTAL